MEVDGPCEDLFKTGSGADAEPLFLAPCSLCSGSKVTY
ncbi:hypothetical protein SAMN06272721_12227 [Arthrobacter sp. P2b]|nr:hypothetical protein SAMN06272721_12227 [Arthrobacter sp. P2b]